MGTLRLPALLALLALACAPRLPSRSGRARPAEPRGDAAPRFVAPAALSASSAAPLPARVPLRPLEAEPSGPRPSEKAVEAPRQPKEEGSPAPEESLPPAEGDAAASSPEQAAEEAAFKPAASSTETAKTGKRRAAPVAVGAPQGGGASPAGAAPAGAPASGGPAARDAAPSAAGSAAPGGTRPARAPAAAGGPPPMSSMNRQEIEEMLSQRLDVGAYRLQISTSSDFAVILFDRTYDAMKDINLFEEFRGTGVPLDRDAYWVRIAFIDLLQVEEDFTAPRLYSLDKRRIDPP